ADAARKHGDLLNIGRQRSQIVDTSGVNELADLLKPDFRFAASKHFGYRPTGGRLLELRFQLARNAHPLKQTIEVHPARTGRLCVGLRREQGPLQRSPRADVGPLRTRAYRRTYPRFHQIDPAPRLDLVKTDQLVDRVRSEDD